MKPTFSITPFLMAILLLSMMVTLPLTSTNAYSITNAWYTHGPAGRKPTKTPLLLDLKVFSPGAQQANVNTSEVQGLEFTVKSASNSQSAIRTRIGNERSARVTHNLLHKGRKMTITFEIPIIEKKR